MNVTPRHIQGPALALPTDTTQGAGASHAPAQVAALAAQQIQTQVRQIADFLKQHVFDAHYQTLKPIPRDVSQADLDDINQHNEGVTRNNQQLDAIADSRARVLQRENETPGDIAETLAKGEKFDRGATRASSAFRAMPFAAATALQYMRPAINKGDWLPAPLKPLTPLIPGIVSGVMDHVGTGVMNRVTGDNQFLKTSSDNLHDAMAASQKRHAPGLFQQSVDMGGAIQGYTARNAVRTVAGTALAGSPKAQAAVDTSIATLGGLGANAIFGNRLQTTENRDHLRGGAYVFGRKDAEAKPLDDETEWLDAYKAIKNATYSSAALNAGKRVAGMPLDILTDSSKAVRSLVSASSLTQNGLALAGGFAGVGKLQELATKNLTNPYARSAVSQLTNTAASAAVFASWTTAGVVTDPATRAAEDFLQKTVKDAASASATFVGGKTLEGAKVTAHAAAVAGNKTAAGARVAAQTATAVGSKTVEGARAAAHSAADGISHAVVTTGAALRAQYDNHVRRRDRTDAGDIELG